MTVTAAASPYAAPVPPVEVLACAGRSQACLWCLTSSQTWGGRGPWMCVGAAALAAHHLRAASSPYPPAAQCTPAPVAMRHPHHPCHSRRRRRPQRRGICSAATHAAAPPGAPALECALPAAPPASAPGPGPLAGVSPRLLQTVSRKWAAERRVRSVTQPPAQLAKGRAVGFAPAVVLGLGRDGETLQLVRRVPVSSRNSPGARAVAVASCTALRTGFEHRVWLQHRRALQKAEHSAAAGMAQQLVG